MATKITPAARTKKLSKILPAISKKDMKKFTLISNVLGRLNRESRARISKALFVLHGD